MFEWTYRKMRDNLVVRNRIRIGCWVRENIRRGINLSLKGIFLRNWLFKGLASGPA